MKKIILLLLLTGCTAGLIAQQTFNDLNAQKRTVGAFHGIHVAEGIELVLTMGEKEEVAVSATTDEFRERIITEVKDGILNIHYKPALKVTRTEKKQRKDLKAYVACQRIDVLKATTGAEVKIVGVLSGAAIRMSANTGAVIKGEINFSEMTIDQSTGSEVVFSGKALQLTAEGSTGSMFKGEGLSTDNCSLTADTGAGINITVQKQLSVKASTGAVIKYKGEGSVVDARTSTGAMVKRI